MSATLRKKTGRTVYRRYPGRELIEMPREAFDLAERRTEYLHPLAPHCKLAYLLACAWMQGAADADAALSATECKSGG